MQQNVSMSRPRLFPDFASPFERRLLPAGLEKSSFGKYLVLVRATDFSPVSARKDGSFGQIGIGMVLQC